MSVARDQISVGVEGDRNPVLPQPLPDHNGWHAVIKHQAGTACWWTWKRIRGKPEQEASL